MSAPGLAPYWHADIKFEGTNTYVLFDEENGWTGDVPSDFLDMLRQRITTLADAAGVNIYVVGGYMSPIFAEALRSLTPVYGIETNFDQGEDDSDIAI